MVRQQLSQDFSEMRSVSSENLLYIKEDLIIPHVSKPQRQRKCHRAHDRSFCVFVRVSRSSIARAKRCNSIDDVRTCFPRSCLERSVIVFSPSYCRYFMQIAIFAFDSRISLYPTNWHIFCFVYALHLHLLIARHGCHLFKLLIVFVEVVLLSFHMRFFLTPFSCAIPCSFSSFSFLLQHFSFYDLIVTKARGKSGPLFHFDVHDDIRIVHDTRIEKDESHPGKVSRIKPSRAMYAVRTVCLYFLWGKTQKYKGKRKGTQQMRNVTWPVSRQERD